MGNGPSPAKSVQCSASVAFFSTRERKVAPPSAAPTQASRQKLGTCDDDGERRGTDGGEGRKLESSSTRSVLGLCLLGI